MPGMANTLTATLRTNQGPVVVRLFPDQAPKTVRNFTELAEGGRGWKNPATGATTKDRLYDGTVFHRVIAGFMIQGGDPLGTGVGGPGYKFADEIHPDLRFDRPYLLAMANAGPSTNGSQFFITTVPTPHLNGKHTICGGRPTRGAVVTWALVAIHIVLYVVEWARPGIANDLEMIGLGPVKQGGPAVGVATGQWYRLITSAFLPPPGVNNLGPLDIIFNVGALIIIGPSLGRD